MWQQRDSFEYAIIRFRNLSKTGDQSMIYINAAIAAGKSSLTQLLSKDLGTEAYYEQVEDMPMLKKFYSNAKESRYNLAFPLQIAFLNYRYSQLREGLYLAQQGMRNTVYDSSLLSDSLMAYNLYKRGEFPKEEYDLYLDLVKNMQANISGHPFNGYPDLVVYLDMSFDTMLDHIQKRGREMEDVRKDAGLIDYYKSVWTTYKNWAASYSQSAMVTIDMDQTDFVNNRADQHRTLKTIEKRMRELRLLTQEEYKALLFKHSKKSFSDFVIDKYGPVYEVSSAATEEYTMEYEEYLKRLKLKLEY